MLGAILSELHMLIYPLFIIVCYIIAIDILNFNLTQRREKTFKIEIKYQPQKKN
jgi:hypothetical protein